MAGWLASGPKLSDAWRRAFCNIKSGKWANWAQGGAQIGSLGACATGGL